jgi:hypothetical protein
MRLVSNEWRAAFEQSRENVTHLNFATLGINKLVGVKNSRGKNAKQRSQQWILEIIKLYPNIDTLSLCHADLRADFVVNLCNILAGKKLNRLILAFCTYNKRKKPQFDWKTYIPELNGVTIFFIRKTLDKNWYADPTGAELRSVDDMEDNEFFKVACDYKLEGVIPIEQITGRIFDPNPLDDGVDYSGNDLSIRNGLYEPWSLIQRIYLPNYPFHFLMNANDILDEPTGYMIGHALMVKLIKSCPAITAPPKNNQALSNACKNWFHNDKDVQDCKLALQELIKIGLDVGRIRDNLRDDTVLDMAHFLDQKMKCEDDWSFVKLVHPEPLTGYKNKYKNQKKQERKGRKRKGLLGAYDESEDEDYQDVKPKRKKNKRSK